MKAVQNSVMSRECHRNYWCMMTSSNGNISLYWPFVRGIHRSPVDSHHKGQWRGALMYSLVCTWTNGWANSRDAGELRRLSAHYDVTVMGWLTASFICYDAKFTTRIISLCDISSTCCRILIIETSRQFKEISCGNYCWNTMLIW